MSGTADSVAVRAEIPVPRLLQPSRKTVSPSVTRLPTRLDKQFAPSTWSYGVARDVMHHLINQQPTANLITRTHMARLCLFTEVHALYVWTPRLPERMELLHANSQDRGALR